MKTCKEYRVGARAALKGNMGMAILVMLVYGILVGVASMTFIGGLLLSGAFTVGLCYAFVNAYRQGSVELDDLFRGFRNNSFTATIGVYVQSAIYFFLWSLLFCIPGIVALYRYSMAPYILADHPEITGAQAIAASKQLMKGKKGKLFCLKLSYIGWILLCPLTFGILTFWVAPWMKAAEAGFYESIKDEVQIV